MANILWNQLDKEKQEKYIKTVRSVGYRFVEKEDTHD